MGLQYQAVGWNRQKKIYDSVLVSGVALYLLLFVGVGFALHPEATAETMLIRALGTSALVLLHVVLCIGPLARIDKRFLPLLYNRRHLGVTMFLLGLAHGVFSLIQFHALGNVNPLVSVLVSNTRFDSISQFPFQPLGLAALTIFFLMAATSHDFWLANLSAPVWKALHMLVYVAYALVVLHVALGVLQAETNVLYVAVLGAGVLTVAGLHLVAALGERSVDRPAPTMVGTVDVCLVEEIPEKRAKIVTVAGERVAVFRYDGKLSAVSNVCQHQNGPLGEGRIVDGLITCPWHGYQYKPNCGVSPDPFKEKVPTFKVRVTDGHVLIEPKPLPAGTLIEPAEIDEKAPPAEPRDGDFFVGYLPKVAGGLARFLRPRVVALVASTAILAVLVTAAQRPFSTAVFEYGETRTFDGWVQEIPYPTLLVERPGADARYSRYLLVNQGKLGATDDLAPFSDKLVRLTGTLVFRDDRTMIELVPDSVQLTGDGRPAPGTETLVGESLGTHTFKGEIVDSKCFLGVMKPGNLKPHRACATRCISGGVPPVLLVRRADETALYLFLTDPDGGAVNDRVLDLVAEPVEITGKVLRYDDLLVLQADPETFSRIE
jgi:nitrite reductase/ring-hydroxylating ferredoxin subunit/DMSO/TMAO reductase YedYZ heme-binding membrane subunit